MGKASSAKGTALTILLVLVSVMLGFQIATAAPRAIASPVVPGWMKAGLKFLRFDGRHEGVNIGQEDMQVLYEVFDRIGEEFINTDFDPKDVIYGAASGAVTALGDPYSRFVRPDPGKEMQKEIKGVYSGIGITIEEREGFVVIMNVFPDGPADKAGLSVGDIISSVNGENILEAGSMKAVQLIRGEENTDVTIGVLREGYDEEIVVTATRADVKYPSVWEWRVLDGGVGYVEVTEFNKGTAEDLRKALAELGEQGVKGVILDLRNNAGGPLDAAVYVSDIFVPDGDMVYLKGRDGHLIPDPVDLEGKDHGESLDLPLVVLINQFSASASEIVAGAVQDYGVGTIMGQRSFGKGVVQNVIPLSDGSYLVLTTNTYLTPKERDINSVGIEPDVPISLETEDIDDEVIVGILNELDSLNAQIDDANTRLREYLRGHDYQLEIARKYLASEIEGETLVAQGD